MKVLRLTLLFGAVVMVAAPGAHAAIPQGNTLLNPNGETGTAVSDETSHICPQGWACDPTFPNTTLVKYGTTTFPSIAESARIGGGNNFFAGGPANNLSGVTQTVNLGVQPEFNAGAVIATFSGCLGGFGDQDDSAIMQLTFFTPDNPDMGFTFSKNGPKAAERGSKTQLVPVSQTVGVPPTTRSFRFTLTFLRGSAGSAYNDGYADNLSVTFGPSPGTNPPASSCSAPSGGGGGGGGGGGAGGGPGGGSGGGEGTLKLLSFGKSITVSGGKARVRVKCNTSQVSRCRGTLTAGLVRASKSAKRRLGTASYSIRSLESRSIRIPLRRSDARKIRTASKRTLSRLRLRLRATTKVSIVKFRQTELLRVKRRG